MRTFFLGIHVLVPRLIHEVKLQENGSRMSFLTFTNDSTDNEISLLKCRSFHVKNFLFLPKIKFRFSISNFVSLMILNSDISREKVIFVTLHERVHLVYTELRSSIH